MVCVCVCYAPAESESMSLLMVGACARVRVACLQSLTVCVSVAVPAEGQDPGGGPQGDATGEGAVTGGPALPRPALQAAAGHCSPRCYSPLLVTHHDSFPPSLLLIATVCNLFLALLLLCVIHCPHCCALYGHRMQLLFHDCTLGKHRPSMECIRSTSAS